VHLARVKMRLMPERLEPWPHEGPVVVREGSGERAQYHVIDAWQHLATFDAESAAEQIPELARSPARRRSTAFQIDSYRILTRFLRESRHRAQPLSRVLDARS
jgi:hypothetical protein